MDVSTTHRQFTTEAELLLAAESDASFGEKPHLGTLDFWLRRLHVDTEEAMTAHCPPLEEDRNAKHS